MADALSDFLENKLHDLIFRGQTWTGPTTLYIALFTSAPTDSGGGTEVSGGSYARASITASLANWSGTQSTGSTVASSGTSGQTSNNNTVTFPSPTASWGSVVAVGVYDASTSGNLLTYATLAVAKTVNSGDAAPAFPANSLVFTLQ